MSQLQVVPGEHLASVRRDEHDLLHADSLSLAVAARLEGDDHPRLEHGPAARDDPRLLVPVRAQAVTGMVGVVQPTPGDLDELRAIGRGRPLDLIITPFVCAVDAPVTLAPNEREVQHAFWLPLAALRRRETLGSFRHEVNGQPMEHQAFIYEAHTIWGITYRILTRLLEVVA